MRHERVDDIVEVDEAEKVLPIVAQVRSSEDGALTVHDGVRTSTSRGGGTPSGRPLWRSLRKSLSLVPRRSSRIRPISETHVGGSSSSASITG